MADRKGHDVLLSEVREKIRSAEAKLERQLKDGTASSECEETNIEKQHTQCFCHLCDPRDSSPEWASYCTLRHEIGELKCQESALVEEQRTENLLAEYYEEHPNARDNQLECPVCMDAINLCARYMVIPCCGKFICNQCSNDLFQKATSSDCPFCRTPNEDSLDVLEERVANDNPRALWQKANRYVNKKKMEKALVLLHRAFDGGFLRAADSLGLAYYHLWNEDESNDTWRKNALSWSKRGFENGSIADNGYYLGMVSYDNAEAVKCMTISASVGWIDAQLMLARWFYEGERGLEKSLESSRYWAQTARQNTDSIVMFFKGNGQAMYDLGFVMWELAKQWYGGCSGFTGHEVRGEVFDCFRKSAEQKYDEAISSMEAMKKGQAKRCSNALCAIPKEKCTKGFLPVQCMRCSFERYCSLQCLASDWKARHKDDCRPWQN